MSRELEQLLHDTAVEPHSHLDTTQLMARGRRRRRVRHASAVAGSLAAFLVAVGVVTEAPILEPRPPEIADRPEAEEPAHDDRSDDAEAPGTDLTPDREVEGPATIPARDADSSLLAADGVGVHRITDDGRQQLWDVAATLALPDRSGGAVVQEADEGAIRRVLADGEARPPFATPEQRPTLHAVVEHQGRPTVLFTRRQGQGDAETETLHAYRLDDSTEERLGTTGRLGSGLEGVGLVAGELLLSRCHLDCSLVRLPWGADPESDQPTALHDRSLPIHGLDVEGTTAAYVHVPRVPVPSGDDQPHLWLHDVAEDDRVEIPLPPPGWTDAPTISVDLAADGTAAIVAFRSVEQGATQTLLVDRLDQQPRARWLDTTGSIRFDHPNG